MKFMKEQAKTLNFYDQWLTSDIVEPISLGCDLFSVRSWDFPGNFSCSRSSIKNIIQLVASTTNNQCNITMKIIRSQRCSQRLHTGPTLSTTRGITVSWALREYTVSGISVKYTNYTDE